MDCIWKGDMTHVRDLMYFAAILDNLHTWAMRVLRPWISGYIDLWLAEFPLAIDSDSADQQVKHSVNTNKDNPTRSRNPTSPVDSDSKDENGQHDSEDQDGAEISDEEAYSAAHTQSNDGPAIPSSGHKDNEAGEELSGEEEELSGEKEDLLGDEDVSNAGIASTHGKRFENREKRQVQENAQVEQGVGEDSRGEAECHVEDCAREEGEDEHYEFFLVRRLTGMSLEDKEDLENASDEG